TRKTLLYLFLFTRRKSASRKAHVPGGRPDIVVESLPVPVYDNVSTLTNRSAAAAQREPIEEQDDLHYANIYTSCSENQVQSDQKEQVLYSLVNIKRPNAVPEDSDQLYSTINKQPRV
ncbi:hypothetical protein NHX12_009445, partial [Muraenolepis orangiensis]